LQGRFPLSPLVSNPKEWTYRGEPAVEVTIKAEAFPEMFAADVQTPVTKVLTASPCPLAAGTFEEPATAAVWQTKPSWALVAAADQAIIPEVERFGAKRAGATAPSAAGETKIRQWP
jgi:hypothetical protein